MKSFENIHRIVRVTSVVALIVLLAGGSRDMSAQERRDPVDSVRISLHEAEQRFLDHNLQLLASTFNIEASKAAVMQARLWSNPNLSLEQNVYNQYTRRVLDFTKTGNTDLQIQQLILLGGKRGKQVRIAEINSDIAGNSFFDLLRELKLELRTDFFDLYFLRRSLGFYDESIASLKKTIDASERILEKRSILLAEVLRLKSLMFSLESERLGIRNRISDSEGALRVLLADTGSVAVRYFPVLDQAQLDGVRMDTLSFPETVRAALENRPDLLTAEATVESDETNIALQKAMAVPDVTLGAHWSRNGSYIPDYYGITVAVDLPLFNRNQGAIIASERTRDADALARDNVRRSVEREVVTAYHKALDADSVFHSSDRKFAAEFGALVDGMNESYRMRNISIIQFTDFYESYRTSVIQVNQLQNDRLDAIEGLNYAAGKDLVKLF